MLLEITHSSLKSIVKDISGVLLDAYGVFWGGNAVGLLPGSKEAMAHLVSSGKIVGILSNSTQPVEKEIAKFRLHDLYEGCHFHFAVTSAEVTTQVLQKELPFKTSTKKYWLFGSVHPKFSHHYHIFENTEFQEVSDLDQADFIYISIPHVQGEDQIDISFFKQELLKLGRVDIPMLCANPDLFAFEGNPPQIVLRQGSIAKAYEEMGGKVFYTGKPSSIAYQTAMTFFQKYNILNPSDIIMIGDTPETDIRGGRAFGMKTALITESGILKYLVSTMDGKNISEYLKDSDWPDFFLQRLNI